MLRSCRAEGGDGSQHRPVLLAPGDGDPDEAHVHLPDHDAREERARERLRAALGRSVDRAELPEQRAGAQRLLLWPLADERAQLEVFRERVVPLLDGERT
jgi:hypothetical protein